MHRRRAQLEQNDEPRWTRPPAPFFCAQGQSRAWRLWSADALAEAEAAGKPIFLSIGYTACHWCHVMNQESFTDPEIAALINENFIPVLVDREERPDLDQIYQAAVQHHGPSGRLAAQHVSSPPKGVPFFVAGYPARAKNGWASPPSAAS